MVSEMKSVLFLENRANLSISEFSKIAMLIEEHHSIKKVVEWAVDRDISLKSMDAVAQDEFSHDIYVDCEHDIGIFYESSRF